MSPVLIFVLVPWMLILGAFGYGLTRLKHSRPRKTVLTLRNLGAARMFQGLMLVMGLTIAALIVYMAGGCEDGFKSPARCQSISDELGNFAAGLFIGNMALGTYGIPLVAALAVAVNFLTKPMTSPESASSE